MKSDKKEPENFRETLRKWRKHMDLKHGVRLALQGKRSFGQEDAARFLGVPLRTYEGWERARNPKVPQGVVVAMVREKIEKCYKPLRVRY